MLFTGAYPRSLDDKLRLPLPKPIREILDRGQVAALYVTPGTDGSLSLFTQEGFSEIGRMLAAGSLGAADVRSFGRLFFAQAQAAEIDGQGRIRIPAELARLAQLNKEVVLLGVRDHLELWDAPRWQQYVSEHQPRFDEVAARAMDS